MFRRVPVLLALSLLPFAAVPAAAQAPIHYDVSFEGRAHREMTVRVTFPELQPGPLELRMSRTSPGRYALHEFAKNVYGLTAVGIDGREVTVERPDPHQWTVSGHGGEVSVTYTLYADRADGTYSQVDGTHAHLNVPATFLFARDLFERPVEVAFDLPEGWEVASQLVPTGDPAVFTAPDVHYFMDSPLEIADLDWREWIVTRNGQPLTIRVAMHHRGTDAELDRYAAATESIADELAAVFGEYPRFDHGVYTFLACYLPWASGDGMEHRNSTVLTSSGSLARSMTGLLGTVAHEFVHAWSIERIRPATLEPFDFEEANMSRELWFGEGFTSYYDDVALVRAGVIDETEFVRRVGNAANTVILAPGRRFFSPVEMSMRAPFVDAATSIDPTNTTNTFLSYYTWGSVVALGLDLTLRSREEPLTLDHLMREMWRRHGDPERPYTVEDVEAALAAVTGDAGFAREYFDRYVRGREVPDFQALFAGVGAVFGPAEPDAPYLGASPFAFDETGARVLANTRAGGPLWEAGIDRGDLIRSIDGRPLTGPDALAAALADAAPGDLVTLEVEGRGESRTVAVTLGADPTRTATIDPEAPAEAAERRAAWIEPRAGGM